MPTDLTIRCLCGQVTGILEQVSPKDSNHVTCACKGCLGYTRALGREQEMLDEYGGTTVFQISPARFKITTGKEQIGCLQQTKNGAFRWYAKCCKTPLANTLPMGSMPFLAIHPLAIETTNLDQPLEAYFGPLRVRTNHKLPRKQAKEVRATWVALLSMLLHFVPMFFRWKFRGDHKRSPLFHPKTLRPVVQPRRTVQDA